MKEAEIDRIAVEAGQLPESERKAFVVDACAGDARDIAQVLEFIGDCAFEPLSGTVNQYQLIEVIGKGGTSVVYRAVRQDGREFALKLLKPTSCDSKSLLARFEAEGRILERFKHRHIAKFVDSGSYKGQPYFVMELLHQAESITGFCQKEQLALAERLRLFRSVCDAVAYAHRFGITHRDLKPDNVLVSFDQDTRRAVPKLIDFGIAKALEPDSQNHTQTMQGQFVGTRAYASPEQMLGQMVDNRTDVYGLGLILYELLAEKPVVDLSSHADTETLQRFVCDGHIQSPSNVSQHKRFSIPRELDSIVKKALSKSLERRYPTVAALQADIENFEAGAAISTQESFAYKTLRFVREHTLFTVLVCVLAVSLCVSAWSTRQATQANRKATNRLIALGREVKAKDSALERATEAESEAAIHLDTSRKVARALSAVFTPPLDATPEELHIPHRDALVRASEDLAVNLAGEPIVEAEVRCRLGVAFRDFRELDHAIQEFARAAQLYSREHGHGHAKTLDTELELAVLLNRNGKSERALTLAESVLHRRLGNDATADVIASIRMVISDILLTEGRFEEGLKVLLTVDVPEETHRWTPLHHSAKQRQAELYRSLSQPEHAIDAYEQIMKYQAAHGGIHDSTRHALANLYTSIKRAEVAAPLLEELVRALDKAHPRHIETANVMRDLAGTLNRLGDVQRAQRLYLKSLYIEQAINGTGNPATAVTLCQYARMLRNQDSFAEAEALVAHSLNRQASRYGDAHRETAGSIETMASIFDHQAIHSLSLVWRSRLLVAYCRLYGCRHEATINTANKVMNELRACLIEIAFRGQLSMSLDYAEVSLRTQKYQSKTPLVVQRGAEYALEWVD